MMMVTSIVILAVIIILVEAILAVVLINAIQNELDFQMDLNAVQRKMLQERRELTIPDRRKLYSCHRQPRVYGLAPEISIDC